MINKDNLVDVISRIASGRQNEGDEELLLQVLGGTTAFGDRAVAINGNAERATIATGNGNIILNITFQSDRVQIDDRCYQGAGAEALRAIIQEILRPTLEIDWQQVSRSFLDEQLRLTTNLLTAGEGISYRAEQVYVPLGLVERKRQTQRGEDVSPEQGSLLYEEVEITQRFENKQFLEQVLQQGQSPKSRGKRIAIIGEPGAGKTTLLQQIAQYVSKHVEGAIAIWVPLADLRGQELELYLLERWLQAAARKLGHAEASNQVKDAFVAQFQRGRVWLLLDGVDEMQVSSGNPLTEIERQVRMGGLLSQARIVLSCRLNLWDGDRHALLDTFDTYRTLEFSYPQQVEQFIEQWFGALQEAQEGQAERLYAALKAPGRERIRDLVKNPLRLTLLCFDWYLGEGALPETKAGLYEQFITDFYEWKQELFSTTTTKRKQLTVALEELSWNAIDKEQTPFRLRHDFVCSFLGEPDELGSLFQLALQLGWLNKVGVEAEYPRRAVYAFFHPTFQEYFAASWLCKNQDIWNDSIHHIFDTSWHQIFLLASNLLPQPDSFLQLMKRQIDCFLAKDKKLQEFLVWVSQKESSVNVPFKPAAVRAYYLALNKDYRFDPFLMFGSGSSLLKLACSIDNSLFFNLEFDVNLHLACTLGNAYALTYGPDQNFADLLICHFNEALSLIAAYISGKTSGIFDFQLSQSQKIFEDELEASMLDCERLLQNLRNQLPIYEKNQQDLICWCHTCSYNWAEELREIMIKYRSIGYDWDLHEAEKEKLEKYQSSNKLLVDCLNNVYNITPKARKEIEESLILPINTLKQ